jgi:hypothetical protein
MRIFLGVPMPEAKASVSIGIDFYEAIYKWFKKNVREKISEIGPKI